MRVMQSFAAQGVLHKAPTKAAPDAPQGEHQRVLNFMANRFNTMPDVATHIGQIQNANCRLAAGMAQWMPKVQHTQGVYVIEATAGSGKTQLALALLQAAARQKRQARYVCFNRPLADHLAQLTPVAVDVSTFHQLCRDHAEHTGLALDFAQPDVFGQMQERYLQDAEQQSPTLDLLIIDESQDLDVAWMSALMTCLRPDGRLYVMGDSAQQLYERDGFDLPDAVHIRCMDNFRSPRQVVQTINTLGLTPEAIDARSVYEGHVPYFHEYGPGQGDHLKVLNRCLQQLWQQGLHPEQVVVLSYRGFKNA
jgi:AAA domain